MKEKWKAVGWTCLYMAIAFAVVFTISFGLGFVIVMIGLRIGVIQIDAMQNYNSFANQVLQYLQQGTPMMVLNFVQELIMFAGFGLWYYFREKKYAYRPNYKKAFSAKNVFSMAGIAFFGQYAVNILLILIFTFLPGVFAQYQDLIKNLDIDAGNPVLMVFSVVVFGPLVEEILFRGMIFGKLRRAFSFWPSAVISAVLFGVFHLNLVQGIYAGVFGLALAYIFEKTETLWGCYLLHALFNMSSYIISGYETALEKAGLEVPVWTELLISVASIVIVSLLIKFFGKRTDRKPVNVNNNLA